MSEYVTNKRVSPRVPMPIIAMAVLSLIAACVLGFMLLWTGQRVQQYEAKISSQNANVLAEQERIRILRAEWARLNTPERLDLMLQKAEQQGYYESEGGDDADDTPAQDTRRGALDHDENVRRVRGLGGSPVEERE